MLLERMRSGVEQLLRDQDGKNAVIVGHGGIFTFTLKDICREIDLAALIAQYGHNCSITEIEMHGWTGAWRAQALGRLRSSFRRGGGVCHRPPDICGLRDHGPRSEHRLIYALDLLHPGHRSAWSYRAA